MRDRTNGQTGARILDSTAGRTIWLADCPEIKEYTGEEKVAILRRHFLQLEPATKLCGELRLPYPVFERWRQEFFEKGAAAFQTSRSAQQERIEFLEKTIRSKDEVVAAMMAEHVALNK